MKGFRPDAAWLDEYQAKNPRRQVQTSAPTTTAAAAAPPAAPGKSKYRSLPVRVDGHRFPSLLEADRYCELKLERAGKLILYFIRQAPFHLPGGVIYRVDFGVCLLDGSFRWEDTKGIDLQEGKNKRAQVLDLFGVEVVVLKRAQVSRTVTRSQQ